MCQCSPPADGQPAGRQSRVDPKCIMMAALRTNAARSLAACVSVLMKLRLQRSGWPFVLSGRRHGHGWCTRAANTIQPLPRKQLRLVEVQREVANAAPSLQQHSAIGRARAWLVLPAARQPYRHFGKLSVAWRHTETKSASLIVCAAELSRSTTEPGSSALIASHICILEGIAM